MSASKAKAARRAERADGEPYVHLKPTRRVLGPVPIVQVGSVFRPSGREIKRRARLYGVPEAVVRATEGTLDK